MPRHAKLQMSVHTFWPAGPAQIHTETRAHAQLLNSWAADTITIPAGGMDAVGPRDPNKLPID